MAFPQSTVVAQQGAGVPGAFFDDSPRRAQEFVLNSALASYNIIGATGFSKTADEVAAAGNAGGALPFAGILISPKEYPLLGVSGNPLGASLALPNNSLASLCTMGSIWVTLPAAAALGDLVIYDNTTGAISTITPTTTLPGGKSPAYAFVDYFTPTTSGLAIITLSPTVKYS